MPRLNPLLVDSRIDPDIALVARRAEHWIELAFDKAVAHTLDARRFPVQRNSLEALLVERLKRLPTPNRRKGETRADMIKGRGRRLKAAQQKWRADYTPSGQVRATSRHKMRRLAALTDSVELASARSISEQLPADYLLSGVPRLTQRMRPLAKPYDPASPASQAAYDWLKELIDAQSPPGTAPAPSKTQLECVVESVTCLDETDGFVGSEAGADEIRLGGMKIGPDGRVKPVSSFKVLDFGQDGAKKSYSAPNYKRFADYTLKDAGAWPRVFIATFVLAEIDMGGLGEFLSLLVDQVKMRLAVEIATAVGAEAAAALIVVSGVVAAAIVVVLMFVVCVIVVAVFDFLKTVWEDDVFDPVTVILPIESPAAADVLDHVADNLWGILAFEGHGGLYQLRYSWRTRAPAASGSGSASGGTGPAAGSGPSGNPPFVPNPP